MIQVLKRAADVLAILGRTDTAEFGQICAELELNKPTLSHILKALCELGYAVKSGQGRYALGDGIVDLARERLRRTTLAGLAEECVRDLAERTGESATIGVLRDGERYNIAKVGGRGPISVDTGPQLRPSPWDTATGRTLLAFAAPSALEETISRKGLPGDAWPEASTRKKLTALLEGIRSAGVARHESGSGEVISLAVPIMGPDQTAVAAVGVSIPVFRMERTSERDTVAMLRDVAARVSRALALREGREGADQ